MSFAHVFFCISGNLSACPMKILMLSAYAINIRGIGLIYKMLFQDETKSATMPLT